MARVGVCLEPSNCNCDHMNGEMIKQFHQKVDGNIDPRQMLLESYQRGDEDEEDQPFSESTKDCTCCGGFFTQCNGEACEFLGVCHCMVTDD